MEIVRFTDILTSDRIGLLPVPIAGRLLGDVSTSELTQAIFSAAPAQEQGGGLSAEATFSLRNLPIVLDTEEEEEE